jgi:hypothetical protein
MPLKNSKQAAVEGKTEEALLSLLEVDEDVTNRLIRMTQQETDLMKTIQVFIS